MPTSDLQLLLLTHRGSQSAARALWHAHAPRLIAYARALLRTHAPADAEDVVQSAFCRIMSLPAADLAAVRDVGPWLAQLTRNAALNTLRSLRRDAARRARIAALPAPAHPPSADPLLSRAIDALPARLREVIVLKHIAGLTFDQIELATGINRNTAAARYRSAIALLRSTLLPDPPPASALPPQHLVHHA